MTPLLALFLRSLRSDVRAKFTYLGRAALALVTLLFLLFSLLASGWSGAPGLKFFHLLIHLQAFFLLLVAFSYFASAITEEKEENTLGLLRMTDLNPLSILLGKSTSRLCGAGLMLLGQVPFTLLAITLGGVTLRQVGATYCALGAFLFFLCNLALLCSLVSPRTGAAALLILLSLVLLAFLPGLANFLASLSAASPLAGAASFLASLASVMEDALPFSRLGEILSTGFAGPLAGRHFASNLLAGAGCFALAWALFDRYGSGEQESSGGRLPSRAWQRRYVARTLLSPSIVRGIAAICQTGRPGINALSWKDNHFIHGGRLAFFGKVLGYLVIAAWLWLAQLSGSSGRNATDALVGTSLGILTLTSVLELSFAASRIFRTELNEQTLATLVLTPLPLTSLAWLKLVGCYRALLPGAIVLGSSAALGWAVDLAVSSGRGFAGTGTLIFGTVACVYFIPQMILLVHLIAYLSLRMKRGALPLGLAIMAVGNVFAVLVGGITMGLAFLASPVAALILSGIFQSKSVALLEELAAEN